MSKVDVYEIVTGKIIEQLEKGVIPWRKPWKSAGTGSNELFPCYSYSTGKRYDIINQILLDFIPGDYITFEQCNKAGGKVKKGAESKIVVGWVVTSHTRKDEKGNPVLDDEGNELKYNQFGLRYYRVFHIDDTEGVDPKHVFDTEEEADPTNCPDPSIVADTIINGYLSREKSLTFESKKSNQAYYSPSEDKVVVPGLDQYESASEYYSTAFHELTHSTMKKSRCDRETDRKGKNVAFGSSEYSKEELVAEIGAAALCNIAGIETDASFQNSASYIENWLDALKKDSKMIVFASAQADKAVNYILGES